MSTIFNLSGLPQQVRKVVEPYSKGMLKLHGDNLKAIIVYGSSTGEDFIPGKSNINLLLVFSELKLRHLKLSLKLVARGRKKGIIAPLFLTEKHIATSLDTFPIEFLEMKENHVTIYGQDILETLEIKNDNIRLQCEQQLKGKLIRLRQAYLEIGLRKKGVEALLIESLTSLIPIFRNMLRLKGWKVSQEKEEIINRIASEFSVDKDVFLSILKDKRGDEKIAGIDADKFLEKYLIAINRLAIAVDKLHNFCPEE